MYLNMFVDNISNWVVFRNICDQLFHLKLPANFIFKKQNEVGRVSFDTKNLFRPKYGAEEKHKLFCSR